MTQYLLAIDQGTTGSTALVLGPDASVVGRAYSEIPPIFPRPGWVEHDPEALWNVTLSVASLALRNAGVRADELSALGITNQRETVVLWDRSTGAPVANAVVWQDRRTAGLCAELTSRGLGPLVREHTGLPIDPYFSATKITWLLENMVGLRERAERGEIAFGTVDSWLLHRLTGGARHETDVTNASRTMIFDIRSLQWDETLLNELSIPAEVLPDVHPSRHCFGRTDPRSFLGCEVPILGILGDQQSALFAQACFEPGQAKNTYGTGSFVMANAGTEIPAVETMVSTVAYQEDGSEPQYALEGPIFSTGSAVQWLRDELGIIESAGETEALAKSVAGTDDVWFVPALTGLGAPHWDPYARGTLVGITRGTTRAHIVRAVLDSIAYLTRDVIEAMAVEPGFSVAELRADGGAASNGYLIQTQADILGIPVDVPENLESTSLGAAFVAGLGAGIWRDHHQLADLRRTRCRFEPKISVEERDARYARWQRALDRSRQWAETAK